VDRAPPKLPNTASRLIAMAVSLVGESTKVMIAMRCSEADFHEYSDGRKEPSWPELDKLITLIVREQGIIIAKNRVVLDALRSKKVL
jgi:hypothetical protein